MPELAEVRRMRDFINESAKDRRVVGTRKSNITKNKFRPFFAYGPGRIIAESRGKELMIILKSYVESEEHVLFTMGMSGGWKLTKTGEEIKHSHLMFDLDNETTLSLVDPRRFAKWRPSRWSLNRGPDPIDEFERFEFNVLNNLHKKVFQKPICEVMLNQRYFNGLGNYLRSQILNEADINPFLCATDVFKNKSGEKVLELCKKVPLEAYLIDSEWSKNRKIEFDQWMKWYQNTTVCYRILDKTNRAFWYKKKWKSESFRVYNKFEN